MKQFLLVYDRKSGKLEHREYSEQEHERALADRFAREAAEREHPDVEVVLFGADSLEALKRTHARYFSTLAETVERLGQ